MQRAKYRLQTTDYHSLASLASAWTNDILLYNKVERNYKSLRSKDNFQPSENSSYNNNMMFINLTGKFLKFWHVWRLNWFFFFFFQFSTHRNMSVVNTENYYRDSLHNQISSFLIRLKKQNGIEFPSSEFSL